MSKTLTRRDFISSTSAGALGMITTRAFSHEKEHRHAPHPESKRVFRIAHLTDIHVQPEKDAPRGMARALQHAQNLADKPDIIFNGGDSIMDALGADKARTKTQWQVWQSVLRNECSLPVEHCIGNHDVWGWEAK